MIPNANALLERLRAVHAATRDAVVAATEAAALEDLSAEVGHEAGDTIYAIDRVSEAKLLDLFGALADEWPCVLIAEGLGDDGVAVLTPDGREESAVVRIIVDPIDGTRGLMYQKRAAWVLTGVAPNNGSDTRLGDIELALMTEVPLVKQHLSDSFWAIRGEGAHGERYNRLTGASAPLAPRPSGAATIAGGYGQISRFFPGNRAQLAAIDDALVRAILGPPIAGRADLFEDQYICSGGQIAELLLGHDRWVADLRPLFPVLGADGQPLAPLCCHPYDLCTELVAREAGVIITDARGAPLDAPLDVHTGMAWVGYANAQLRDLVAPALQRLL